jgi:hypothetical protein
VSFCPSTKSCFCDLPPRYASFAPFGEKAGAVASSTCLRFAPSTLATVRPWPSTDQATRLPSGEIATCENERVS